MRSQRPFPRVLLVAVLSVLAACRSVPPSPDVAAAFRERLTPKSRLELQRDWYLAKAEPLTWAPKGVAAPVKDYRCAENGWRAPVYARTADRLHQFYVPTDDLQVARWSSAQRLIADYQKPSPAGAAAYAAGRTVALLLQAALLAAGSAGH